MLPIKIALINFRRHSKYHPDSRKLKWNQQQKETWKILKYQKYIFKHNKSTYLSKSWIKQTSFEIKENENITGPKELGISKIVLRS